jgi:hypothetical protein
MAKYNPLPSAERLRELFSYDGKTGALKWLVRKPGVNASLVAGVPSHGYIVVRVDGVLFQAHRIIWKIVTGNDPIDRIDHEDMNRSNNAWSNLREADNGRNMMNAGLRKDNATGAKSVFWEQRTQSWRVRIGCNGAQHDFGRFKNFDDAVRTMTVARERLHGVFARAA